MRRPERLPQSATIDVQPRHNRVLYRELRQPFLTIRNRTVLSLESLRAKSLSFVKSIAAEVFGNVAWQPPRWWSTCRRWSGAQAKAVWTVIRTHPRQSAGVVVATGIVLFAVLSAWRWYERQPKPVEIELGVEA